MQTAQYDITDAAWVNVINGESAAAIDVLTAGVVLINAGVAGVEPALSAPAIEFAGWPNGPAVVFRGLQSGAGLWVRAKSGAAVIVVIVQ